MPDQTLPITPQEVARATEQFSHGNLVLMLRFPFWGSLLSHMRVFLTRRVPTASVDSRDRLFINPDFFNTCGISNPTNHSRAFLLAHEVAHPALGIFARLGSRDKLRANIAHDHVINLILKLEDTAWVLPSVLCNEQYSGMAFEEVYDRLPAGAGAHPQFVGDVLTDADLPGEGEVIAIAGNPDVPEGGTNHGANGRDEASAARDVWASRLTSALLSAKARGMLGAGAERLYQAGTAPIIDWTALFRARLDEVVRVGGLDWGSPSRRSCSTGVYSPKEYGLGLDAALYVDTSGSVDARQLGTAFAVIRAAMAYTRGSVRLLEGDAQITSDRKVRSLPEKFTGGGGTSFVPLFEHLRNDRPVRLLVIITDTFGTMPAFRPRFPVFWLVHNEAVASASVPFGTLVPLPPPAS